MSERTPREQARIAGDERGSALVVALIFIGVWSIVIFAILTFAETGFRVAGQSSDQRQDLHAADAAVEAAITFLAWGGDAGQCPPYRFEDSALETLEVEVRCADPGDAESEPEPEAEGATRLVDIAASAVVPDLGGAGIGNPIEILRVRVELHEGGNGDNDGDGEGENGEGGNGDNDGNGEPDDPEPTLPLSVTVHHWDVVRGR